MPTLSDADWRLIERAYRHTGESLQDIAGRFGISPGTINNRRRRHGWPPRRAGAVAHPAGPAASSTINKTELVGRLYRLIDLKLEQLEDDMARNGERTPADHERETRALGTLIRNFEKVSGLERENSNDGKQDGLEKGGPEQHAEAEAIRREIAERLVRLRKTEQRDAG